MHQLGKFVIKISEWEIFEERHFCYWTAGRKIKNNVEIRKPFLFMKTSVITKNTNNKIEIYL